MSLREVIRQLSLLILLLIVSSTECRVGKNAARNGTLEPLRVREVSVPKRSSLEAKCDEQVKILMNSMEKREQWALEMIDASSKIPSGIFKGNIKDLGMYDQCVAINVTLGNETIRGQHCMYTLDVNLNGTKLPLSPTLSVCFPATCKSDQVKEKMQGLIGMVSDFLEGFELNITSTTCSEVEEQPWELGTVITLGVFGALLAFLLICTAFDVLSRLTNINSHFINTLCKFSLIINGQRILSIKVPKDNLPVITGLRFYSMCWVILGHAYIQSFFGSVINIGDAMTWFHSWSALYILIAQYSVDTFLVMSGFLTSYLFLKEMARGRKFNIFSYYIHRYIRLTPAFMALLLISTFLLPKLGSGALWQATMETQSRYCKHNGWPMALYVHNYVYKDGMMCLGHTWYLAVDMQLYWVSPIIIYPLYKWRKLGLIILCAAMAASVITPAVVAAVNKFTVELVPTEDLNNVVDMMLYFYIVTYTRAGPWVLGVLVGYLLATGRKVSTPGTRKLGWMLATLAFAYSFFTYRIYQSEDYQWNIYWETFNAGVARHIWAFGVCWIIYISALGHGGILAQFLSLPIYLPFSRISYSIYLIHFVVQTVKMASARVSMYFSDAKMLDAFLSDLVICILGGFAFSLVFESPFLVLEKLILTRKPAINQPEIVNGNHFEKLHEGESSLERGVVNNGFEK